MRVAISVPLVLIAGTMAMHPGARAQAAPPGTARNEPCRQTQPCPVACPPTFLASCPQGLPIGVSAAPGTAPAAPAGGGATGSEVESALDALIGLVGTIVWPLVLLLLVATFRKELVSLAPSIRRFKVGPVEFELAEIEPHAPDMSVPNQVAVDFRHGGTTQEISDTSARAFVQQLYESAGKSMESAEVDLAETWWVSRLYLLSILLDWVCGLRQFVFVESGRLIGTASPQDVRWSIAQRYVWLERAFQRAYGETLKPPSPEGTDAAQSRREPHVEDAQPGTPLAEAKRLSIVAAGEVLYKTLNRIQGKHSEPPPKTEWILLDGGTHPNMYEHTRELDATELRRLLGKALYVKSIPSPDLRVKERADLAELIETLRKIDAPYIAVTSLSGMFHYLIKRELAYERIAEALLKAERSA